MNVFTLTTDNKITTSNGRGTTFEIWTSGDKWHVFADNAARRAWRTLGVKTFETLEEVEDHYKSLKGISALAADLGQVKT